MWLLLHRTEPNHQVGNKEYAIPLAEIETLCNLNLRSMNSERQQGADLELVAQQYGSFASEAGIRFHVFNINTLKLLLSFDLPFTS